MLYQYYVPHPPVCHAKQYKCCKTHINTCRLAEICKTIEIRKVTSVCKRDCASCTYIGCSMPMQNRQKEPLYVSGVITAERLELRIEIEREKERIAHRKNHARLLQYYNTLWGDYQKRKNEANKRAYHDNPEYYRAKAREYRKKRRVDKPKIIPEEIMPECRLDCENCKYDDCILPEDWRQKKIWAIYREKNKDIIKARQKKYYEEHKEELRAKKKRYYAEYRDKINEKMREKRMDPKAKQQKAEYDKQYYQMYKEKHKNQAKKYYEEHKDEIRVAQKRYYEEHKDEIRVAQKRYCVEHQDEIRAYKKRYYEEHKAEISARRKQERTKQHE